MWPWEHLCFGYLLHWSVGRARGDVALGDRPVLVLAFATQFPDLVDKPLAWWLHVLPNGLSLAHSALVALPLSLVVAAVARRAGHGPSGVAFGVGYGSHLLGDMLFNSLTSGRLAWTFLAWPLVARPTVTESFGEQVVTLLGSFAAYLATPAGGAYLGGEAVLVGAALLRWRADGYPGLGHVRRGTTPGRE
ncbi:MAG: metal-dependent hydrolase [Haloferacaceae archaeon]